MVNKKSAYNKSYQFIRYHSDPEYRKKIIAASAKYIAKRTKTDSVFRKKRLEWVKRSQKK